jgi:hypothetical protein
LRFHKSSGRIPDGGEDDEAEELMLHFHADEVVVQKN